MTNNELALLVAAVRSCNFGSDRETVYLGLTDYTVSLARAAFARSLADALATTNPRFNRARFMGACGVAAEKE